MPEATQVHINVALTNLSVGYRNPAFISDLLAPPVSVRKQQDRYYVLDLDREAFRVSNDKRAPGTRANEVDFALSTDSYYCEDHALTSIIPDEERENADPAIQPDMDRTEFLSDKIDLNKEIELARIIAENGDLPGVTLSGGTQWSHEDSNPLAAVEAGKAAIIEAVQVVPNTLVLPQAVFAKVRTHPQILQSMQFSARGIPTAAMLAELFDVERVLVPRAVTNTATPGQTPSMQAVWGNHAFLAHVPSRPALKTVAFACTFAWTLAPGSVAGRVVETWREPGRKGDVICVQRYYDQKMVCPQAIHVWKDAVA